MLDLVVGQDVERIRAGDNLALGQIRVLGAEQRLQRSHCQPVMSQLRRIHIHAHRGQGPASQVDLPDPGNLRQLLLDDGRGGVIHLRRRVLRRGQPEDHHG
jgi:hypothetical protein